MFGQGGGGGGGGLVWCLVILRGPGVVVFSHPEGNWCGGVWSS